MTILERLKRREQRAAFLRKPALKWRFSGNSAPLNTYTLSRPQTMRIPVAHKKSLPEVDILTQEAIKGQVERLLADSRDDSFTLLSLANALTGNRQVLSLFADALVGSANVDDRLERQYGLSGMPFLKTRLVRNRQQNEKLKRRYQFMNVLNQLEARSDSNSIIIRSWNEAKDHLSTFLAFPENPDETAEGELTSASDPVEKYRKRLEAISLRELNVGLTPSQKMWLKVKRAGQSTIDDEQSGNLKGQLEIEYKQRDERLKSKQLLEVETRMREEEALKKIEKLMRPLEVEEKKSVEDMMDSSGSESEVIAKIGTDSICRGSFKRLAPGQWLNDEVIHYFYVTLANRDEELCQKEPTRRRSHFFKSFFMTQIRNEGHMDPAINGTYEYRNVKRWSKKVPGKDIFKLDKIFFPINEGQMHWVCAVAYMQEKRIQFYDSFGGDGTRYLETIFHYIKDEHQDKKGAPLPDEDEWQLVTCRDDTPQQRNGYDCGVFTCMFADFLSKDCPLLFDQSHVSLCRERIALSILRGQALE